MRVSNVRDFKCAASVASTIPAASRPVAAERNFLPSLGFIRHGALMFLLAMVTVTGANTAFATTIQVDVTAVIDNVLGNASALGVVAGDTVTGEITYDSTLTDTDSTANRGTYGPPLTFVATYGAFSFRNISSSTGRMVVVNDQPFFGDTFLIEGRNLEDDTSAFTVGSLAFNLRDTVSSGQDAINDDNLPLALDLADWIGQRFFSLSQLNGNSQSVVNATVTSVSTSEVQAISVPEPTTIMLFAIGAIGMLGCRNRKQQMRA